MYTCLLRVCQILLSNEPRTELAGAPRANRVRLPKWKSGLSISGMRGEPSWGSQWWGMEGSSYGSVPPLYLPVKLRSAVRSLSRHHAAWGFAPPSPPVSGKPKPQGAAAAATHTE